MPKIESCTCKPLMHGSPPTFMLQIGETAVGPPGGFQWNWSQIGRHELPGPSPKPLKSSFLGTCVQDASQEAPKWPQRAPKEGPEVDFWSIFDGFGSLFSLFLAVKIDYLNRNSRYHVYLLSDAITGKVHTFRLQATCLRKAGGMCVAQGILGLSNVSSSFRSSCL